MAASSVVAGAVSLAKRSVRLSRFIDSKTVKFRGGNGGDGCIQMMSLFANELAGPGGGNGGCGGHVVLRANRRIKSLNHVADHYTGKPGERGYGKNQYGSNAEHTFIEVPVGTMVVPAMPKELAEHEHDPDKSDIIAELDQEGSMFIAARGGAGGRGNASYLSNKNRHPRVAEAGAIGEENNYELRMRIYAHIGLIGLPNAGKSTLLRTMTGAQVEIGDYAFTTRYPQVGVIQYEDDFTQLAISDLPGLIEDSHLNRGLGVRFLRNIKRCACLLYVIDLTNNPVGQMRTLVNELEMYCKGLSYRPHLILANKIDEPSAESNLALFKEYLARERPDSEVIVGSTRRGDNLEQLRLEMRRLYDVYKMKNEDDSDSHAW